MKRFTCTDKWRDPWFRKLTSPAKQLWGYLLDNCDKIGLIDIDLSLASADCGQRIDESNLAELAGRLEAGENGKHLITKFIYFQYGTLSEACNPHRQIIELVRIHGLVAYGLQHHFSKVNETRVPDTLPSRAKTRQDKNGQDKTRQEGVDVFEKRIPNSDHSAFIQGWSENFKAFFGFDYQFDGGRDGKAVKALLGMGIIRIDLLEIAKKAWPIGSFYCKQSLTIHGFRDQFNYIQNEVKNGVQANKPNPAANPRNRGVCRAGPEYAEAAKRKQIQQADAERQRSLQGQLVEETPEISPPPS